jgi:ABC-type transporter MlaC component
MTALRGRSCSNVSIRSPQSWIGRTFDLEVILRQVIGPRLAALPPDQRAAVGDAFRRYTIASYVANFDTYSGQRFEIAPCRQGRR